MEEIIAHFLLIQHRPHRERSVQNVIYCCLCIPGCCNIFTEPLLSNDKWIHILAHRLMGEIYEVRP
jgi:hypothetical protein